MHCPICKQVTLKKAELDSGLFAQECSQCHGKWIQSYFYWRWREKLGGGFDEIPAEYVTQARIDDNRAAKLCPECGHLLIRYPVGHQTGFELDRCGNCGGVWFDAREWETLRARNLHDDVHKIFSEIWQNQLRREERDKNRQTFYQTKFGPADYQKAAEFRLWLHTHPLSHELFAFVNDPEA